MSILFMRFRGGVHPPGNKGPTADKSIRTLPMPNLLYVPLQQHIGAPAQPEVEVGQHVLKGQRLARSQGMISAPVHAPTSGTIVAIEDRPAPHPSGLGVRTVVMQADGEDRWLDGDIPDDPFALTPEEIATRVGNAGIVGLGGATFPSAVKLNLGLTMPITTLVINGSECEPYLTCDDRLMRERAAEIVDGIRLMLHALCCPRALIAIEDNKSKAIAAMRRAAREVNNIQVVRTPTRYPMGSEKQLISAITGLEIPAGKRAADINIVMHNVGTAYAVHQAIRLGRPLVSRIVTVGGGAVREPQNLEVPLGTSISDVIAFCGGLTEEPDRIVMGGPMMGQVMPSIDVPVVKGTSGIIALAHREVESKAVSPCIRCGRCVEACPIGLMPLEMASRIRNSNFDAAVDFGLTDCISCGSCSYVCPSNIPLVHYFNFGKGELTARQQAKQRADETRRYTEARTQRKAREEEAKAAAAAAAQARKAAKEAAERKAQEADV